jgi:hypothetical protein
MDLATLDIDVQRAKAGLDEYTAILRTERSAEDEAIAAAYRAAARGHQLISLSAAVALGGFFDNGLPRIAITRADAKVCTVDRRWGNGDTLTYTDEYASGRHVTALVGANHVRVAVPNLPPAGRNGWHATTTVPVVAPRFRPRRAHRLRALHILWEVEAWDLIPPRDPALLRHIRGDLWAVLATWDLTDVERHVLAQRRPAP